jgi:hypothetical protein
LAADPTYAILLCPFDPEREDVAPKKGVDLERGSGLNSVLHCEPNLCLART